ncbi:MAG: hypothetical protein P8R42_23645 [Candidatus Binatia bacterium]|nr:hypothetical protein [Candidatus Binatia bacterium]
MAKNAGSVLNGGGLAALDDTFGRGFVHGFFDVFVGASAGSIVASLTVEPLRE